MDVLASARLPLENQRFTIPSLPPGGQVAGGAIDKTSKLYEACQDFQAVFIKQMLDTMRKTVDRSQGLVAQSQGEKLFEDMLYDEHSKTMSKTAGFGLADTLYRQIAYLQDLPRTTS